MKSLQSLCQGSGGSFSYEFFDEVIELLLFFQRLLELGRELGLNLVEIPTGGPEPKLRDALGRDQNAASPLEILQFDELLPRRGAVLGESTIDAVSDLGIENRLARFRKPGKSGIRLAPRSTSFSPLTYHVCLVLGL